MMKFVADSRGQRMSYQKEERSRLRRQTSKQAITLAMEGKWKEAVAVNRSIIEMFPDDVEALNRLGRAYLELGEYSLSEEAYRRTGGIDPFNIIARKNLQRLSRLKETAISSTAGADRLEPQSFVEEIGKAGVVRLVDPAPPEVLVRAVAGDRAQLRIDGSTLIVENKAGEYLGKVETEHGQRLARLAHGGNRYSAVIVSSAEDVISIIIREVYQHPSQAGRLSFPAQGLSMGRTGIGDRALRRELEHEESASDDPGYIVVGGGEEAELLVEETFDDEDVDEEL
jgi:tetratricopeptide (TPR) repeat protein